MDRPAAGAEGRSPRRPPALCANEAGIEHSLVVLLDVVAGEEAGGDGVVIAVRDDGRWLRRWIEASYLRALVLGHVDDHLLGHQIAGALSLGAFQGGQRGRDRTT